MNTYAPWAQPSLPLDAGLVWQGAYEPPARVRAAQRLHDAPKGRERIRRTEDWTSLDVDAVPMVHPNTVGLT